MSSRTPLLILAAGLLVVACSSTALPASAQAIAFDATSSPSLRLYAPHLYAGDGHIDLRGLGFRYPGQVVPPRTHVDVRFLDAQGRVLREQRAGVFLPGGRAHGGLPMAKYRVHVGALPPGTARVQVEADESGRCGYR